MASRTRVHVWLVGLCFFLAASVSTLHGQVTTADIVGNVTDTSGAVLPGANVTITNQGTSATQTVNTDSDGQFQVRLLPPGRYRITVELQGFNTNAHEVALAIGDRFRLDSRMAVGTLAESIVVTGESPVLQTQTATVASLVDERAMQDLPLNGRNFVRLAQLTPGVTEGAPNSLSSGNRPDDRRQSSSIQINGQNSQANNFLIDGLDNNERFIGTVIVRPSVDAISELRVETSVFSAELGHTIGGVINVVSKSGSNAVHGSAFEFYRNEAMDSRNYFAPPGPKPLYRQNQFGGSIGGPIVRNRTFFFGDYGGFRQEQGQNFTATVPTAAMRTGDFSGISAVIYDPVSHLPFQGNIIPASRLDPAAVKLINMYPLPQSNAAVNFAYAPLKTQDDDSFDVRLDHRLNDASLLFGRVSYNNTTTFVPNGLPPIEGGIWPGGGQQFPGPAKQVAYSAQTNYNRVLSPELVFEGRFGYSRYDSKTLPANYGLNVMQGVGVPGINIDSDSSGMSIMTIAGFTALGDSGSVPLLIDNKVYQSNANLTFSRGSHSIKTGFSWLHRNVLAFQSSSSKGSYAFNANFTSNAGAAGTGNGMASFLLGYPSATTRSKYLVEPHYLFDEYAGFVQYDWRARTWLTINAGLRYDLQPPMTEADDLIANVDLEAGKILVAGVDTDSATGVQTDTNDFAPRLGFAASLGDRTVLRGGWGITSTPGTIQTPGSLRNPPYISLLSISPPQFVPGNRLSEGLPAPEPSSITNPTGALLPTDFNVKTEYVHQYNLALQRQLPGQMSATVALVGVLGRDAVSSLAINTPLAGAGNVNQRRPFAQVFPGIATGFNVRGNFQESTYRSVQTMLEKRFSGGWGARFQYTWSHNELYAPDGQAPFSAIPALANPYPEMLEFLQYETSDQGQDVRHRATVSANYELPFAREATGVTGALAKGWQVNVVGVMQSGVPFTVQNSSARANTGGNDRPDQVCDPNLPGGERVVGRWFDTSCFVAQTLNTFGNTGTNTVRGPGAMSFDLSVFKSFVPYGGHQLQIRVETFNIFNRANFANPDANAGASTFGVISSTGNNLSRNVQLAVKYLF